MNILECLAFMHIWGGGGGTGDICRHGVGIVSFGCQDGGIGSLLYFCGNIPGERPVQFVASAAAI